MLSTTGPVGTKTVRGAHVGGAATFRDRLSGVRIDRDYLLALDFDDPGFDYGAVCDLCSKLPGNMAMDGLLARVAKAAHEDRLFKAHERQRTHPRQVFT